MRHWMRRLRAMDLEGFIVALFDSIQDAAKDNSSYILELTQDEAKELAKLWSNIKWFELY